MQDLILSHLVEILFTIIVAVISFVFKKIFEDVKKNQQDLLYMQQGLQSLLRNSIIRNYNDYMEREYIPVYAMESVTSMYEAYHNLGGNGTVTKLFNELQELPTKKRSK